MGLGFGKAVNGDEALFDHLPKRIFGFDIDHRTLLGLLLFQERGRTIRMKADLIRIVDRETLSPGGRHWPDGDIIPALVCRPRVLASSGAAMKNQAPEVVGIETAADEPDTLQRCQAVSIDVKAYDGGQSPGSALR
jgi:hypothetical protein